MQIDSFPGVVWFSSYGGRLKEFRGERGRNGMEEGGGDALGELGQQRQLHVQVFHLTKREPRGLIEEGTRQKEQLTVGQ